MTEISPLSVSEITEHIRAIVESDGALRRDFSGMSYEEIAATMKP